MTSFSNYGQNNGGESPWGLMTSHKCNVSNREPKDEGGLIATLKRKHLRADESMG